MSFKDKLYNIKSELNDIKSRNKAFEICIKERLSMSIDLHSQHVKKICDYLKNSDSIKVLRQVKELNKKKKRLADDKVN